MREKEDPQRFKIVNQTRTRTGFAYGLRGDGERLTLEIAPRDLQTDENDWRVAAHTGHAADSTVVSAWGATRLEAVRELARAWRAKAQELQLPPFDWEAIEKLLAEVRAV